MDVHAALARDRGRHLFDDPQPEGLQDRHEVGEVDLATGLVELDAREALPLRLVAEPDEEPFRGCLELLEHQHVVDDEVPFVVRLVVVREPRRVLLHQDQRATFAHAPRERIEQVVFPASRQDLDLSLELLVADVGDRDAGGDVDREEDPRRLRLSEREVVIDRRSVEPFEEQRLEAFPQVGVESVARQSDHDRDVASVEVPADQDPDPAVFLELEEPCHETAELLGRGLEELVLGEGLEERHDRLVVVGSGDQIFRGDQLLELVMQERRFGRGLHVCLAREETDQPGLADDRAVGRDLPHADVVHARPAVHGRVRLGLRIDQQLPVLDPTAGRRARGPRGA